VLGVEHVHTTAKRTFQQQHVANLCPDFKRTKTALRPRAAGGSARSKGTKCAPLAHARASEMYPLHQFFIL
jgi:hypothetical protein